jgi:hypothetical protein
METVVLLTVLIFAAAVLYSSVGHAGASGYLGTVCCSAVVVASGCAVVEVPEVSSLRMIRNLHRDQDLAKGEKTPPAVLAESVPFPIYKMASSHFGEQGHIEEGAEPGCLCPDAVGALEGRD